MVAFVTRGSEPAAGEAEPSAEGGSGGFPPDYDKTIRQRVGGDECNKRFVGEYASARADWLAFC
jgi:hypothetical protein